MKAYRHILLVTGLLLTFFAFVPQARGEGWEHHDTVPAAEAPDAGVIGDADATAAEEVAAENKAEEAVDVKGIVFGHIGDSYDWHITTWGKTHRPFSPRTITGSGTVMWVLPHVVMCQS